MHGPGLAPGWRPAVKAVGYTRLWSLRQRSELGVGRVELWGGPWREGGERSEASHRAFLVTAVFVSMEPQMLVARCRQPPGEDTPLSSSMPTL